MINIDRHEHGLFSYLLSSVSQAELDFLVRVHIWRVCGRPSLARACLPISVPGGRVSDARAPSPANRSKSKPGVSNFCCCFGWEKK